MKRTLLIATVATLAAGAASAQSSVTVYGRLNTSIERQKYIGADGTQTVLQNNGSRLGFKGVEDLGGGLKAGFTLEHRFDVDTGAATNGAAGFWGGAGESSVNLSGGFGMIKAGHYTSEAYFATSDVTDLLNHGTGTSADALYKYLGGDSNKVSYRTPDLGGLTAELGILAGEGKGKRAYDFAANYGAGPFGLGFGYEKASNSDSQFAFRGSYVVDAFAVTGYVQRYKNDALDASKTIYRISGQYNIGAAELHAAFGAAGKLETGGVIYEDKLRQYTVGANYNLSKRTKVFAFYSRVNTEGDKDPSSLAVGVRHNF